MNVIYITMESEKLWRSFPFLENPVLPADVGSEGVPRSAIHSAGASPFIEDLLDLNLRGAGTVLRG